MNVLLVIAGVLATGVLIGHSTLGRRDYFLPMLSAEFDPYAKRIMSFVWHMSTLSLCLMALALLALGGLALIRRPATAPDRPRREE